VRRAAAAVPTAVAGGGGGGGDYEARQRAQHPLGSGAYRVFTRKRAILVNSPVKIVRTRLGGAGKSDFAHNN